MFPYNDNMITKAVLVTEEDNITIGVPFAKVDQENRIVSGFATLDNVDKHGDVVTSEASEKAFSNFRGNVREQHLPIAAGKVVNFRHQEFYDTNTEKMYSGIYVDVYVSKGAPDTWEKVIDGTLTGFSIGGSITKAASQYVPDEDSTIRYITDYELIELSLVDSPANHLCNVFSITKSDGVVKADGMAVDTQIENVFWCENDRMAVPTTKSEISCSACNSPMQNIGWFESSENKTEKMRSVIEIAGKLQKSEDAEGGSTVKEEKESTEDVVEEVNKSESASEVTEPDFENLNKALAEIKSLVEKYNETDKGREEVIKEVRESVTGFEKTIGDKFDELLEKHNSLAKDFTDFKQGLDNVQKRLDGVEAGTAVKKSHDAKDKEVIQKQDSSWSGTFLPDISNL